MPIAEDDETPPQQLQDVPGRRALGVELGDGPGFAHCNRFFGLTMFGLLIFQSTHIYIYKEIFCLFVWSLLSIGFLFEGSCCSMVHK